MTSHHVVEIYLPLRSNDVTRMDERRSTAFGPNSLIALAALRSSPAARPRDSGPRAPAKAQIAMKSSSSKCSSKISI